PRRPGAAQRVVGSRAHVPDGSAQRDEARHLADAPRGVRHDGRGDPRVDLLRCVSLGRGPVRVGRDPLDSHPAWCAMTEDVSKHWYIVHTYSGFENKVKESLEQRVQAY